MNKNRIKKHVTSIFLLFLLGFGISLQVKAGIGQSMLNAFALLLADLLHMELGTFLNLLNLLFFVIYLIIRKSRLNPYDLIQIIATITNGYIVNFFVYSLLNHMILPSYFLKVIVFIIGLCFASISLGAILAMGIIQFPLESLCLVLGKRFNRSLTVVRKRFDIFFLTATIFLTFLTHHTLYIREGTILSFLLLSRLMGLSYEYHKARLNRVSHILVADTSSERT
jgi:uncharacterized membrane protein YczE